MAAAGIMAMGSVSWNCLHAKEPDSGRAAQMDFVHASMIAAWEELKLDMDRAKAQGGGDVLKLDASILDLPKLSWSSDGGMQAVVVLPARSNTSSVRSAIISKLAGTATSRKTQVRLSQLQGRHR